jgi:hypothetical protein
MENINSLWMGWEPHLVVRKEHDKVLPLISDIVSLETEEGAKPVEEVDVALPWGIAVGGEVTYIG